MGLKRVKKHRTRNGYRRMGTGVGIAETKRGRRKLARLEIRFHPSHAVLRSLRKHVFQSSRSMQLLILHAANTNLTGHSETPFSGTEDYTSLFDQHYSSRPVLSNSLYTSATQTVPLTVLEARSVTLVAVWNVTIYVR